MALHDKRPAVSAARRDQAPQHGSYAILSGADARSPSMLIDILLDATRVALSDDARKSLAGAFQAVRKQPAWKALNCDVKASIERRSRHEAVVARDFVSEKLSAFGYHENSVSGFATVFHELLQNAFDHGCADPNDKVKIELSVNSSYAKMTVHNPDHGPSVEVELAIAEARRRLELDTRVRRGRGLLLVSELADELQQAGTRGLTAVIYREHVELAETIVEDVVVVTIYSGLKNPSFSRRLRHTVAKYRHRSADLIVNLRPAEPKGRSTDVYRELLEVETTFADSDRRVIVVMTRSGPLLFPQEICAATIDEALQRLGKSSLAKRVGQVVSSSRS
ncbi:MAG: ATP-binding protein [Acidobacteria bacterium]|nr:ATP-binding protein [Acidobacteriota bacterium]